jgi:hypothetical protein
MRAANCLDDFAEAGINLPVIGGSKQGMLMMAVAIPFCLVISLAQNTAHVETKDVQPALRFEQVISGTSPN